MVHEGQQLEATVDALPGRVFAAYIKRLGSELNPRTRRLEICAELSAPDGLLKPGMRASLRIRVGRRCRVSPSRRAPCFTKAMSQPSGWHWPGTASPCGGSRQAF